MNAQKNLHQFWQGEPPGQRTNAIRWMQKKVMQQAASLPRTFQTLEDWEAYKATIRQRLPEVIGIPKLPPLKESVLRARVRLGENALCERVDVYVDDDYAIPCFVISPFEPKNQKRPSLLWNPGWPQDKWDKTYQEFALRMVEHGFITLILDHAPFGETSPYAPEDKFRTGMTQMMGMGQVLGYSQLGVRAMETMRCGEYLRSRADIDPRRIAISGLCQGGMDTWLVAALDDTFCAAAPMLSESTFAVHFAEMASYFANADSSPFPFGILKVCDVEHLHAAIAPRPLLVRGNLPDQWWPVSGFDDIESFTRQIYRLYSAEDRLDFRTEAHVHNLTGPFADALEAFLIHYVKEERS